MKASPILTSFNSGEWSPLMIGRVDLKTYSNACRRMRNFIPTRQGPARRRPGNRFVAEVKQSANRTWLARFKFNTLQAYVLEFGDQYIRFFSNHGVVGAPLEVASPYLLADLTGTDGTFQLRFVQSNDVLYIVHAKYWPRKLQRTGAAAFNLTQMAPVGGPFKKVDLTTGITVYAGASTGNTTLTASAPLFTAAMVGSLFYLEQKQADTVQMWESGKVRAINDVRRSDGKNYHALNAATTGTVKPTHNTGARYDGDGAVQWQYDDPGYGWCQITGFTDTTHVNVTVLSRIPDNAVGAGNPTLRWAQGEWNDTDGYPDNVTFFRERLCFARNRKVWQSNAGDFENFKAKTDDGLVTAECAITSDITSDQANNIQWFAPSDIALLTGTAGDETMLSEISTAQALGPGNIRARKQSEYGARHVPSVRIGDAIIYVQASGRKVRSAQFQWQKEGYVGTDLTILAQHVTKGGIIDQAFQQEPDSIDWCVRADGVLVGLTFDQEQEVKAWHPHRIGGYADGAKTQYAVVESVTTIPAPNNDRDEVWMIVRRVINGATKRYVEYMEGYFEEGDDPEDAFHVDAGLTLNNTKNAILTPGVGANVKGTAGVNFNAPGIFVAGDVGRKIHYRYSTVDITGKIQWKKGVAEITAFVDANNVTCTVRSAFPNLTAIAANGWRMTVQTITGLGHLIGETVQVWIDGSAHPDAVVDGTGAVPLQLNYAASKAHVGLGCPAILQPMPLEAGSQNGTARGKKQRVSRVGIGFHNSVGVQYGREEFATTGKPLDRLSTRGGGDNMDEAAPLYSGVKTVAFPDGYDEEIGALITIIADQAGPCTITHLTPQIETFDDR